MYRIIRVLVVLSLFVGFGSIAAAGAETVDPLDVSHLEGQIAFPVFETGTYNIYVSNIDGSDRELLIAEASQPDFNSDGSEIAFRSWKPDQRGLFSSPVAEIVPWNVQGKVHIESGRPAWSPDDKVIAFQSYEEPDRLPRIYHTAGDSYKTILTDRSGGEFIDVFGIDPDWMPDGSIVYAERECEVCGIFNIDLDGGMIAQVTDNTADEAPAVSPDGSRVAFMSMRDEMWDLYVVNSDGTDLIQLTADAARDGLPVWAPDGQTIIFASDRSDTETEGIEATWGIWAIDADTMAMAKLFDLGGELEGEAEESTGMMGWTEERLSLAPPPAPPAPVVE